jgi:Protein of unknown function (DUF1761)
MDIQVNYIAVLAAAFVPMILGMAWYSPLLFGKQWAKLEGFDMSDVKMVKKMQDEAKPAYFFTFLANIVMAYVMAHFITIIGVNSLMEAAQFGFWAWLGFMATVTLSDSLFTKKPFGLFYINVAYKLANTMAIAIVLFLLK